MAHMMEKETSGTERRADSIKVLVADYTRLGTDLIVRALQVHAGYQISVSVIELESFACAIREQRPNVVLLGANANAADEHTIEMIRIVRSALPSAHAIVLLEASSKTLVVEAFRAGARGVFCRDESIAALVQCVQSVSDGQAWANNHHLLHIVEALAGLDTGMSVLDSRGKSMLSRRETDIVQGVADGLTNKDIGRRLQLSEHTIKNYLLRVFDKLGVSNRAELVSYVLHHHSRGRDVTRNDEASPSGLYSSYLQV